MSAVTKPEGISLETGRRPTGIYRCRRDSSQGAASELAVTVTC